MARQEAACGVAKPSLNLGYSHQTLGLGGLPQRRPSHLHLLVRPNMLPEKRDKEETEAPLRYRRVLCEREGGDPMSRLEGMAGAEL